MKILFIGGTGRLSKDTALLAAKCGYDVYCLTRGTINRKVFESDKYHMIYCDIRDVEKCRKILQSENYDVVVDFLSFSVGNLQNKLDLLQGKYRQYIFISTATVYVPSESPITEDNAVIQNIGWDYSKNKIECEKYIEEFCRGKYTIVRPYVTYGNTRVPYPFVPMDSQKEWTLLQRIYDGKPIPVLDTDNRITLTHTKDFAKGLVGLFGNTKSIDEAFHITGDDVYKWEEVIDLCGKIAGKRIKKVYMSLNEAVDLMPGYAEILLADKSHNWRFDNSKIKEAVPDFHCNIALEEGISDMIHFYSEHPSLQIYDEIWDRNMDAVCTKAGGI